MAFVFFDNSYAPCGFLIVPNGASPYGPGTVLIQSDWDYPAVASKMGFFSDEIDETYVLDKPKRKLKKRKGFNKSYENCSHDGTDGTVTCPDCGKTVQEFINQAYDFIQENQDTEFDGLDEYIENQEDQELADMYEKEQWRQIDQEFKQAWNSKINQWDH